MTIRAYLRASTNKQDANRAEESLKDFVKQFGQKIDVFYRENESGTKLNRPQLNQLLADCDTDSQGNGDILLVEDIDRLTRLKPSEWEILDGRIKSKGVKLVIMSLPLSHEPLKTNIATHDDITRAVMKGMSDMMIQILATIARNDYDKRRYRQRQGIDKVLADPKTHRTKYKGKQANTKQYERILRLIDSHHTYKEIKETLNVSNDTIVNAKKWRNEQQASKDKDNQPLFEPSDLEQPKIKRRGRKPTL
nr:recombinase family protein [Moraxella sp. CTOTU47724]